MILSSALKDFSATNKQLFIDTSKNSMAKMRAIC